MVAKIIFGVVNFKILTPVEVIPCSYELLEMITGRINTDDDRLAEIIIKGGPLALIAIALIADFMITDGQVTMSVIRFFTGVIFG